MKVDKLLRRRCPTPPNPLSHIHLPTNMDLGPPQLDRITCNVYLSKTRSECVDPTTCNAWLSETRIIFLSAPNLLNFPSFLLHFFFIYLYIKQLKHLLECEHSTQLSKTPISYYFGNLTNQSYEYVKYKIFNPNRKMREMNTQFKVSKHNFILSNFVNHIT